MTVIRERDQALPFYSDNSAHLKDELAKLDLLIQRRVVIFRQWIEAKQEAAGPPQRYISDKEVDWLLSQGEPSPVETPDLEEIESQLETLQSDIDAKVQASLAQGIPHASRVGL